MEHAERRKMYINIIELRKAIYGCYRSLSAFTVATGWGRNKIYSILAGKYIPNLSDCKDMATSLSLDSNLYIKIFCPFYHQTEEKNKQYN